jgi:hypothetical protein
MSNPWLRLIERRWTGALESKHTLEINAFVPKADIDDSTCATRTSSFPMARQASL